MKRGAALAAVLLAMTIASALAVGGAFVSRQYVAAARLAHRGIELLPAAEAALVEAIVQWDSVSRGTQPIGSVAALPSATTSPLTAVWITRASAQLFWLVADASTEARPTLHRRIGVLLRDSAGVATVLSYQTWADLP